MNITGHITDISPIRTEVVTNGIPRGISSVDITIRITPDNLQHLNLSRPVELRQPDHPTKGNYRDTDITATDPSATDPSAPGSSWVGYR
ncbi:MAG TPA: hypothetical protein DCL06_06240 [Corynebacterium variabile]|uniref:Uncharacterized protein n=1 Tax=Corynebacterium variabile TaxID=1727 RepID=A0A3B9QU66_9CORY|nr:hypothetical protein [Corynebacterium variabile]